jgi:hypothetical protein
MVHYILGYLSRFNYSDNIRYARYQSKERLSVLVELLLGLSLVMLDIAGDFLLTVTYRKPS